jgi:hypothetical protein
VQCALTHQSLDETKSSTLPWQKHSISQVVEINTTNMDAATVEGQINKV